ncbi:hypothetical protein R6Q59_009971 [Mikania micrantha]
MFHSCSIFSQPRDTDAEIAAIFNGIQQVALETKIDHRFILAIMMQESAGCVRVSTTGHTYRNPGLMQDHEGNATCNENGYAPFPCPNGTITQMIRDGASGTDYGNGLAGALIQAVQYGGGAAAITYYRAARLYNSGAIDPSGNLEAGTATHCYASDIANRLAGWTNADRNCAGSGTQIQAISAVESHETDGRGRSRHAHDVPHLPPPAPSRCAHCPG